MKVLCPKCEAENDAEARYCVSCNYPIYAEKFYYDMELVKARHAPPPAEETPAPAEEAPPPKPRRKSPLSDLLPGGGF